MAGAGRAQVRQKRKALDRAGVEFIAENAAGRA